MQSSLEALKDYHEKHGFEARVKLYTPCYSEARMSPYREACQEAFKDGAQYAAEMTQRVGEILQEVTENLPPKYVVELREIFAKNKEILNG